RHFAPVRFYSNRLYSMLCGSIQPVQHSQPPKVPEPVPFEAEFNVTLCQYGFPHLLPGASLDAIIAICTRLDPCAMPDLAQDIHSCCHVSGFVSGLCII